MPKLKETNGKRSKKKTNEISFVSPVYTVRAVPVELTDENYYNPNAMATIEFKLLQQSILTDGFTMPCVTFQKDDGRYEIVDGAHRRMVLLNTPEIYEREEGKLPITVIDRDISDRMASTIRHNRARGAHSVELMKQIVQELVEAGCTDQWIIKHIGMDADELLRYKQITGIAALFANQPFSKAWIPEPG